MSTAKIAVLVSGRGSNLQALIDAATHPSFPARIACVISDNAQAQALERAMQANIPAHTVDMKAQGEAGIEKLLQQYEVELVCLAGFMHILSAGFVEAWRGKIINIHPSLLPAFKGLNTHQRVIEAGAKITGCTVHHVTAELDAGKPIIQAAVAVEPDDTPESLAARVLEAEHRIYPMAIQQLLGGNEVKRKKSLKEILISPFIEAA